MADYELRFSTSSSKDAGTFRLLELPPDMCELIESSKDKPPSLALKGQTTEDAMLCTSDKTYALRSVTLSNSILVVAAEEGAPNAVVIRDQLNEILELVPSIPKLHKLNQLLKGMEYDDFGEGGELGSSSDEDNHRPERQKFSLEDARREIQSSEVELERGLKERHILIIDGQLRPIAPTYLGTILELLLNSLVSLSLPHHAAPAHELASMLANEHDVAKSVSTQIMTWFGTIVDGNWAMDVDAVLKELGLGILRNHKDEPIPESEFMAKWNSAAGDTFESRLSLALLSGNYLSSPNLELTYFAASTLPVDAAARFNDLFLTRSRWTSQEIAPFLADIAIDSKDRDKLLLKFARATTDASGVWYTARTKYKG